MRGADLPAFARPAAQSGEGYTEDSQRGLSKLEYFAAAALNGLLSADTELTLTEERAARFALNAARALVAELAKPEE